MTERREVWAICEGQIVRVTSDDMFVTADITHGIFPDATLDDYATLLEIRRDGSVIRGANGFSEPDAEDV